MTGVRIWNGSAFVAPSYLKRWNGAAFVDYTSAWIWTGSAYEKVWPLYDSVPVQWTAAGAYSYAYPTWFRAGIDYLDAVLLAAGGAGSAGATGHAGNAGGSSQIYNPANTILLTATGGVGGAATTGGNGGVGQSPGNQTWQGVVYIGGAAQNPLSSGTGSGINGNPPGGGGTSGRGSGNTLRQGGGAGQWVAQTYQPTDLTNLVVNVGAGGVNTGGNNPGGNGADGAVWLNARYNTAV